MGAHDISAQAKGGLEILISSALQRDEEIQRQMGNLLQDDEPDHVLGHQRPPPSPALCDVGFIQCMSTLICILQLCPLPNQSENI